MTANHAKPVPSTIARTIRNASRKGGGEAGSCMFPHLKLLSGHILFSLLSVSTQRKRRGHGGNNYCGFKRTFHLAGSSSFVMFWGVGRFVLRSFVGGNASVCSKVVESLESSRSVESRDQSKAKMSKGRARERVLSSLRCLFLHICYALEGMLQRGSDELLQAKRWSCGRKPKLNAKFGGVAGGGCLVERWGAHCALIARDVDGKHGPL